MFAWVALCATGTAAALAGERSGLRLAVWIGKPIAALSFVAAALTLGALESSYGKTILAGLVLCVAGDVLLIARGHERAFQLGIGSFLLGHVAYAAAFAARGVEWLAIAPAAVVAALLAWRVGVWLGPHVGSSFVIPVRAYIVTIMAMLVFAAGTVIASGDVRIVLGAAMFVASDLAVARERFVHPGFINVAWGLPLYFAAQLVLASTVG